MKTRGFTLIELLGVVTILGVLALVLFPILLKQINSAKSEIDDANKLLIIDAAKDYVEDNINNYKKIQGISYCIDISSLDKYLLDLKTDSLNDIDKTKKIKLTYNNKFDYDIVDSCTYSLTRNGVEVPIVNENSGLYLSNTDEGRLIYRGGEPTNYVWLDENDDQNKVDSELYRIVSFEKDGTIKVVRNESIADMPFDSDTDSRKNEDNTFCNYSGTYYGCNVWGNMNNTYYESHTLSPEFKYRYYQNSSIGTLQVHTNIGTVNTDSTLNTYLNENWITSTFLNYIENHKFNVGGVFYNEYTDGGKGLTKEKQEEKTYTWNGKIGLLNMTEYTESSINSSCADVWSNFYYNPNNETYRTSNEWSCKYDNYNYKSGYHQWSISSYSSTRFNVLDFDSIGAFNYGTANNAYAVRPAFYLKGTVVLGGEGTLDNPYYIKNA